MSQEILIMVYKKCLYLIIALLISLNSIATVIYEKNDLIITTIDISIYKNLYEKNYGLNIDDNNALKDLVLIKNLIISLEKNNNDFLSEIDKQILVQYGSENFENINIRDFLRFSKIKDEFIINYFRNNLVIEEVENIFKNINYLNLPLSINNCLIIDQVVDLKNNKEFIKSFFNNLKNNTKDFEIILDNIEYRVCISESDFRSIERLIINYIELQTKEDFKKFVYGKTKY